jgi:hypothetical protein
LSLELASIGLGLHMYADDNEGWLPTVLSEPTSVWTDEGPITAGTPFTVAVDPGTRLKVYRLKVP